MQKFKIILFKFLINNRLSKEVWLYKLVYVFTLYLFVKTHIKRLKTTSYQDEFHTDLDSCQYYYSWTSKNIQDEYIKALIKSRNRAHYNQTFD